MLLLKQILPAAIVAMMVAGGVCGFALVWQKERTRTALGPLAIGLAYATGHLLAVGWVSFPPTDTTNWLPAFALTGAVLGAFCGVLSIKAWARLLIFALVSVGLLRLLLRPKFQYSWSLSEGWIWVACLGSGIVLSAVILDALVRRAETAAEIPAFLLITCAGTFGALMLSGSILLAQFAAVLGAALLGSLVLAARKAALGRGIVPVFALLAGALLVSGYFFAEVPATSAVLLAFALVPALIRISLSNKLLLFGIRVMLVSVPVIGALVLAFLSSPPLDY